MTVTWTSGYSTNEATPFVRWGAQGQIQILSPVEREFPRLTRPLSYRSGGEAHLG